MLILAARHIFAEGAVQEGQSADGEVEEIPERKAVRPCKLPIHGDEVLFESLPRRWPHLP